MMFIYPLALLLLLTIPVFGALLIWRRRQYQRRLAELGTTELVADLMPANIVQLRRLRYGLWFMVLTILIIALARPVWGIAEEVITAQGVAIMVVLDVSRSMDAQDIAPSRLERAKLTARVLFESNEGNLVGLILFAGDAFVQFPLTSDVRSAITFLNAATTGSIGRQGTDMNAALMLAINTLDDRIAGRSAIVLLSDGENHEASPQTAAQIAAERGIAIYTIGYGTTAGAMIPIFNESGEIVGTHTDSDGETVITRLDESILIEVAAISGGLHRRSFDESGVELIDILNAIDELEAMELEERLQIRRIDRFGIFVFIALCLLAGDMLFLERRT